LGDAILDRLMHDVYRIDLKGESMLRRATKLTAAGGFRPTVQTRDAAHRLPGRMTVE